MCLIKFYILFISEDDILKIFKNDFLSLFSKYIKRIVGWGFYFLYL